LFGDELWSGLSRNKGCGYDDIDFLALFGEQLHLGLDKLLAHLFGISTNTGS